MNLRKEHPYRINRQPKWLRSAVAKAKRDGSIPRIKYGSSMQHLLEIDEFRQVLDHWGTENGRLIAEPYADPEKIKPVVEYMAKALGCNYLISKEAATWNPGCTIRIEFWPKD